jgi:hypothetical protein
MHTVSTISSFITFCSWSECLKEHVSYQFHIQLFSCAVGNVTGKHEVERKIILIRSLARPQTYEFPRSRNVAT